MVVVSVKVPSALKAAAAKSMVLVWGRPVLGLISVPANCASVRALLLGKPPAAVVACFITTEKPRLAAEAALSG